MPTLSKRDKEFSRDRMVQRLKNAVPYPALEQAIILSLSDRNEDIVISAHSTFEMRTTHRVHTIHIFNEGINQVFVVAYSSSDEAESRLRVFRWIRDSLQYLSEQKIPITNFLDALSND